MSHPKRADAFREWSKMMLEQAVVPDRLQYKGQSLSTSVKKGGKKRMKMRTNRRRRRRKKQVD